MSQIKRSLAVISPLVMTAFVMSSTPSAAQGLTGASIELSAGQKKNVQKPPHANPVQRTAPRNFGTPKAIGNVNRNLNNNKINRNLNQKIEQRNLNAQKNIERKRDVRRFNGEKNNTVRKELNRDRGVRKFTQTDKSRAVVASKFRGLPRTGGHARIGGRNYSVWRGAHRVRYHNHWRTFVALSALGVLAIGASEFYPYAYLDAPQPYCDGLTEDGCQLVWQDVETEEGDVIPQCVSYCPWQ